MTTTKKSRMSLKDITQPIRATCARCGSKEATIYAYPLPEGTCYCPSCSPKWLKAFVEFASQERALEKGR